MRLKIQALKIECQRKFEYYSRKFELKSSSSKRCPMMDDCTGTKPQVNCQCMTETIDKLMTDTDNLLPPTTYELTITYDNKQNNFVIATYIFITSSNHYNGYEAHVNLRPQYLWRVAHFFKWLLQLQHWPKLDISVYNRFWDGFCWSTLRWNYKNTHQMLKS